MSDQWQCPQCQAVPAAVGGFPAFAPEWSNGNDGFSAGYFEQLHALEDSHFWFRARNALLLAMLERFFPAASSFLEIGCGTGFVLSAVRRRFPGLRLAGSEVFASGLDFARGRLPGVELFQMDARRLPFDGEFDVIGAFDVLEHIEDDRRVLGEMFRACRAGGGVILTVPQHRFLWSVVDDYAYHKRRYARREMVEKMESAGFAVARATSFVSLLLPVLWFSRWRRGRRAAAFDPLAEYRLGRAANASLEAVMGAERALITRGASLPVGGSLLVIARKN